MTLFLSPTDIRRKEIFTQLDPVKLERDYFNVIERMNKWTETPMTDFRLLEYFSIELLMQLFKDLLLFQTIRFSKFVGEI